MAKLGTISLEEKRRLEQPDKFMIAATRAIGFLSERKKQVAWTICAVLAAALLIAGLQYLSAKKEEKAFVALSAAMSEADEDSGQEYEKAKTAFAKVYEKYPATMAGKIAALRYAHACYESKDYKTAIETYSKVVKKVRKSPTLYLLALNGLGYSYEAAGNMEEAAKQFEKIIENGKESWLAATALFNLGAIYEKMGKIEKSRQFFSRIVSEYPESLYANIAKEKAAH